MIPQSILAQLLVLDGITRIKGFTLMLHPSLQPLHLRHPSLLNAINLKEKYADR